MSALLMLFYWIVVPLIALWLVARMWRAANTPLLKVVALVVSTVGGGWLLWMLGGGEKWLLDRQVSELCTKDGGMRIYETVTLPMDRFNQWGQPIFYRPMQGENALGKEYVFKVDIKHFRSGNPSLRRYHVSIFRSLDSKLLGESVSYDRGGGDLPGPWQPSGFSCPNGIGEISLLERIFQQQRIEK